MVEGLFEEKSGEIVPLRKPLGMFIAEKTPSVGLIPIYYFNGPSGSNRHGHKYVDVPAPSLHGNNRECGAQEVNIIVSKDFTI